MLHYIKEIPFKTLMLKLSLCDHSDACIFFKGTITVWNTDLADVNKNNTDRKQYSKILQHLRND